MNPQPYPITTTFQPNSNSNFESWLISSKVKGGSNESLKFPHFFDKGLPHNPGLPLKDLIWKVSNWNPCGIGPIKWLLETLKKERKVSCVSCGGISPDNLFWDRSNASSDVNFSKDEGIKPVSKLLERLSNWISFKFPMSSGISPSNLFLKDPWLWKYIRFSRMQALCLCLWMSLSVKRCHWISK